MTWESIGSVDSDSEFEIQKKKVTQKNSSSEKQRKQTVPICRCPLAAYAYMIIEHCDSRAIEFQFVADASIL